MRSWPRGLDISRRVSCADSGSSFECSKSQQKRADRSRRSPGRIARSRDFKPHLVMQDRDVERYRRRGHRCVHALAAVIEPVRDRAAVGYHKRTR